MPCCALDIVLQRCVRSGVDLKQKYAFGANAWNAVYRPGKGNVQNVHS
jgi:hypothetical protein